MKEWTNAELQELSKKKLNLNKLKDKDVVLHPEISKWRSGEKTPDPQLLRSLNDHGQIQAITFRRLKDGKLELLAGARRYAHLKMLKVPFDEIKVDIREKLTNKKALTIALAENFFRKDLSPMEEARAVNSMLKAKVGIKEIAKMLNKSAPWVRSRKNLFALPEKIRDIFEKKELNFGYSGPLMKLTGMEEAQAALLEKIIDGKKSRYSGIHKIEEAENFVTSLLKQIEDTEALLAKYGACPKCKSKNIRTGYRDGMLRCGKEGCHHEWHGETREPWEYYELKQSAEKMGLTVEEGPETLTLTPRDVADMIEVKAREKQKEKEAEEGKLPSKFRCKVRLLALLEPLIAGDNIQKLEVHDEKIEIQLIEGKDLYFTGLRKDYKAGEKASIDASAWGGGESLERNHDHINRATALDPYSDIQS